MVSGFFEFIRKNNPSEVAALVHELNTLVALLEQIPMEKFKAVTGLVEKIIDLQKQNPGSPVEPLKMCVEMIQEINKCEIAKVHEIGLIAKEASKLPLSELLKDGK